MKLFSGKKALLGLGLAVFASFTQCKDHAFAAEVSKMMDIIIHSLYKNKEIFLKELIANANDALSKLHHLSLSDNSLTMDWNYNITVKADPTERTLIVQDTGVGMTPEEMQTNLGTIAKSGTKAFVEKFKNQENAVDQDQIGQFGVGFYSSFLAGNVVQVVSKTRDDSKASLWSCDIREGKFSIEQATDEQSQGIGRQGTKVIIQLNEDNDQDYLDEQTLKTLIEKYSSAINYPIYLWTRRSVTEEVPLTEEELAAAEKEAKQAAEERKAKREAEKSQKKTTEEGDIQVEDTAESEQTQEGEASEADLEPEIAKTKKITRQEEQFEWMNAVKPIFSETPNKEPLEKYEEFYMKATGDTKKPFKHLHFKVEGTVENPVDYSALIYFPRTPNFQLLSNDTPKRFLRFYVKRVFITDEFPDFPRCYSFAVIFVDAKESRDVTLNVSRETLQGSKAIDSIKNKLVSKIISLMSKMAKEGGQEYEEFYKVYSSHIKFGLMAEQDKEDRKKELASLLRFHSSTTGKNLTSFDEYIERMKPTQKDIYFVAGSDLATVRKVPYVEALLKRDLEVLYMIDPYDEYVIQALPMYKEKPLKNVAKGGITFEDEDQSEEGKKKREEQEKALQPLMDYLKKLFSKKIERVTISRLLATSPMAIVANMFGWSPAMEKLMKGNQGGGAADPMMAFFGKQKKIMEINPEHPLIQGLAKRIQQGEASKELEADVRLLFDAAMLHSGYELKNPANFAHRVEDMIRAKYDIVPNEKEAPSEEEEDEGAAADGGFSMPFGDDLPDFEGMNEGTPMAHGKSPEDPLDEADFQAFMDAQRTETDTSQTTKEDMNKDADEKNTDKDADEKVEL